MSELPFAEILRPELSELHAYVPTQGEFAVRLDANEAPALLSSEARAALSKALSTIDFRLYPDATASELRGAVAAHCGVSAGEVLLGVGSDEVITMLLTALSKPRPKLDIANILTLTPTFVMYRLSARARGMRVVEVPLDADWDVPLDAVLRGIEFSNPNLIFIASPNNPTGNIVSRERLEAVIQAAPKALVVIDEAYIDYAQGDQLDLYRKYENVAILRTLSKVGFAALRLGWLIARPELIREIDKVRQPYNLSSVTQRLGIVALSELRKEIRSIAQSVSAERERVRASLESLPGISVTPSQANFLWVRTDKPAKEVFDGLVASGILVRSFHERGGRLAQQLRITVGNPSENELFIARLRELV